MTYERDDYMRRQDQEHDMIRMRTLPPVRMRSFDAIQRSLTIERTTLIARPVPHYAHEQAEVVGESWWVRFAGHVNGPIWTVNAGLIVFIIYAWSH